MFVFASTRSAIAISHFDSEVRVVKDCPRGGRKLLFARRLKALIKLRSLVFRRGLGLMRSTSQSRRSDSARPRASADSQGRVGNAHWMGFFRQLFGPTQVTFSRLDTQGRSDLASRLESLWAERNTATDGTTRVEAEYLDVRAIRG